MKMKPYLIVFGLAFSLLGTGAFAEDLAPVEPCIVIYLAPTPVVDTIVPPHPIDFYGEAVLNPTSLSEPLVISNLDLSVLNEPLVISTQEEPKLDVPLVINSGTEAPVLSAHAAAINEKVRGPSGVSKSITVSANRTTASIKAGRVFLSH